MNIIKEIKLLVFCSNSTIAKTRIVTRDNGHSIALTTTHYTINALNAQRVHTCTTIRPPYVACDENLCLLHPKCRCSVQSRHLWNPSLDIQGLCQRLLCEKVRTCIDKYEGRIRMWRIVINEAKRIRLVSVASKALYIQL